MQRVIINSIHSDSVILMQELKPDIVISFDAHPDLGHWDNKEAVGSILKLDIPQKIKSSLFRTSIQALLRVTLPGAVIISVVPEACVITDFNWQILLRSLAGVRSRVRNFTKSSALSEWRRKLSTLSVMGYLSPPEELDFLLEWTKGKSLALDIDADYLFELTKECHTPAGFSDTPVPIYGTPQNNLGSESAILNFITKTKPLLITFSETVKKALDSADSKTNEFLRSLKNLNYRIQKGTVYSDNELEEVLKVKADFDFFGIKQSKRDRSLLSLYLDFFQLIGWNDKIHDSKE